MLKKGTTLNSQVTDVSYDISFIEFLILIYKNTKIIIASAFLFFLVGSGFYLLQEKPLSSVIKVQVQNPPPYTSTDLLFNELNNLFFSEMNFSDWKNNHPNTSLTYDDIDIVDKIGKFKFTKLNQDRFILISRNNDTNFNFELRSGDLKKIQDVSDYIRFISVLLNSKFEKLVQTQLGASISLIYSNTTNPDHNIALSNYIIDKQNFLELIESGLSIFKVNHPELPIKNYPSFILISVISISIGMSLGVLIALIKEFRTRLRSISKS